MMEEKKKRPQLALAQTSPARRHPIERRARRRPHSWPLARAGGGAGHELEPALAAAAAAGTAPKAKSNRNETKQNKKVRQRQCEWLSCKARTRD